MALAKIYENTKSVLMIITHRWEKQVDYEYIEISKKDLTKTNQDHFTTTKEFLLFIKSNGYRLLN